MSQRLAERSRRSFPDAPERAPQWSEQVAEMLRERFQESLSLDELAQSAGVHAVHLARAFRRFHNCTVGEYVRQLRIEFAWRQLAPSDTSLADIATGNRLGGRAI